MAVHVPIRMTVVAMEQGGLFVYAPVAPTGAALDLAKEHGKGVQLGAGAGYWAARLADRGVDITAFDTAPPPSAYLWHAVAAGGVDALKGLKSALLLVALEDEFVAKAAGAYEGDAILLVRVDGESPDPPGWTRGRELPLASLAPGAPPAASRTSRACARASRRANGPWDRRARCLRICALIVHSLCSVC